MIALASQKVEPPVPVEEPGRLGRLRSEHALVQVHMPCTELSEFDEAVQVEHRNGCRFRPQGLLHCIATPLLVHDGACLCSSFRQEIVDADLFEVLGPQAVKSSL